MAAPKRTTKAQSEEGIARFLTALDAHTKLLAFFFGLCFVAALLVLAVWFPQPTAFQYTVFRIVLALAAAGVAGVIPGMIRLKAQPGTALLIHAGGALAVFVMVYLIAPAALPQEQLAPPSPPQKEEKPAAQPLKISGVDAIENGVHIVNLSPPEPVHFVRLSNLGDSPVHISMIGFPEKYFYTNLEHEKSLLQGHADKDMSVVLTFNFPVPDKKEYEFKIQDSAGGTARIAIRIDGWHEYVAQQIQKIGDKYAQGASAAELHQAAKEIITASGYKELASPLQEVFAGQLLAAAEQPEAAALAYAKANKETPEIAERFIANVSPAVKSALSEAGKKRTDTVKEKRGYKSDDKQCQSTIETSFVIPDDISSEKMAIEKYIDNHDGTITDTTTGLMWKSCSEGLSGVKCDEGEIKKYSLNDAVQRFKNISYAGYTDWRLPTVHELKTLVQCSTGIEDYLAQCGNGIENKKDSKCKYGSEQPTINQQAFPNTMVGHYCAAYSMPFVSVSFDNGHSCIFDHFFSRDSTYAVRLVRGGQ